jgi:hypothetical protein
MMFHVKRHENLSVGSKVTRIHGHDDINFSTVIFLYEVKKIG